jgi:hypothetical protein
MCAKDEARISALDMLIDERRVAAANGRYTEHAHLGEQMGNLFEALYRRGFRLAAPIAMRNREAKLAAGISAVVDEAVAGAADVREAA